MMLGSTGRRLRLTAGAAALLLLLTGCSAAAGGSEPTGQAPAASSAPSEPAASEPASSAPAPAAAPTASPAQPAADRLEMAASTPLRVSIPALGLDAELLQTGIRADGTLEVPPGHEGAPASWYDRSPSPGERGASVLLGQVNSLEDESGVFFALEQLQGGETVSVARADGTTAVFEVYRVESFDKGSFPTREVYYPTPEAELRLITCDGVDGQPGAYPNNLVVFAKLVETA